MMLTLQVLLSIAAILQFLDVLGTTVQAFRTLRDEDHFHEVNLRGGVYMIGLVLALGFLALTVRAA